MDLYTGLFERKKKTLADLAGSDASPARRGEHAVFLKSPLQDLIGASDNIKSRIAKLIDEMAKGEQEKENEAAGKRNSREDALHHSHAGRTVTGTAAPSTVRSAGDVPEERPTSPPKNPFDNSDLTENDALELLSFFRQGATSKDDKTGMTKLNLRKNTKKMEAALRKWGAANPQPQQTNPIFQAQQPSQQNFFQGPDISLPPSPAPQAPSPIKKAASATTLNASFRSQATNALGMTGATLGKGASRLQQMLSETRTDGVSDFDMQKTLTNKSATRVNFNNTMRSTATTKRGGGRGSADKEREREGDGDAAGGIQDVDWLDVSGKTAFRGLHHRLRKEFIHLSSPELNVLFRKKEKGPNASAGAGNKMQAYLALDSDEGGDALETLVWDDQLERAFRENQELTDFVVIGRPKERRVHSARPQNNAAGGGAEGGARASKKIHSSSKGDGDGVGGDPIVAMVTASSANKRDVQYLRARVTNTMTKFEYTPETEPMFMKPLNLKIPDVHLHRKRTTGGPHSVFYLLNGPSRRHVAAKVIQRQWRRIHGMSKIRLVSQEFRWKQEKEKENQRRQARAASLEHKLQFGDGEGAEGEDGGATAGRGKGVWPCAGGFRTRGLRTTDHSACLYYYTCVEPQEGKAVNAAEQLTNYGNATVLKDVFFASVVNDFKTLLVILLERDPPLVEPEKWVTGPPEVEGGDPAGDSALHLAMRYASLRCGCVLIDWMGSEFSREWKNAEGLRPMECLHPETKAHERSVWEKAFESSIYRSKLMDTGWPPPPGQQQDPHSRRATSMKQFGIAATVAVHRPQV
uniref:Uncharacterized protein n=1 Tax=Chromera velia CCMP2878 TaxID=1169474 RepID=A0A0G4HXP5_9ALVE|eukprot:Cvel_9311.t1-p1 / transcript=Cvel_9311.t1 / gene=Cvel_9311 / organism=Chromera_velia_CCMP2878 / gene_product=hypothetical protein / transcript_product=hypothetical protein / location=Cvel_scaffold533:64260-72629(+) / protein_length=805 / sequence_SO=supercontig / SO=protein_coding / is_pseudo=false